MHRGAGMVRFGLSAAQHVGGASCGTPGGWYGACPRRSDDGRRCDGRHEQTTENQMRRFAGAATRSMKLVALLAATVPSVVEAQYFGRNKVQYQTFDFRVMSTLHYDLHYYPAESLATADAGRMAER